MERPLIFFHCGGDVFWRGTWIAPEMLADLESLLAAESDRDLALQLDAAIKAQRRWMRCARAVYPMQEECAA